MKEWIITEFEKKNYTLKQEHDHCNDGIGSYEFWGGMFFDGGTDYVSGVTSLLITGNELKDNIENFIDLYEDDIKEVLLANIEHGDIISEEPISFIETKDGKIEIYIEYEAEDDSLDRGYYEKE